MWLIAALGTAVCFGVNNSLFKWGTTVQLSKIAIQFYFYLIAFFAVFVFGWFHHSFHPSLKAFIMGGLIGILNTNGNIQMSKAFEQGQASITSTLIAMNSIIPIFFGAMFFPESIDLVQWIGIILMIGSAVLVQYQPGTGARVDYRRWFFHIFLATASIGTVGTLMKWATYEHINFLDIMLSMYGGGLLYLAILSRKEPLRLKEFKVGTIVGILSVTGYSCYLFALQTGPASIVFPIVSLNCIVVMVAGIVVFKERLKTYQFVGMVIALVGVVLTKL